SNGGSPLVKPVSKPTRGLATKSTSCKNKRTAVLYANCQLSGTVSPSLSTSTTLTAIHPTTKGATFGASAQTVTANYRLPRERTGAMVATGDANVTLKASLVNLEPTTELESVT